MRRYAVKFWANSVRCTLVLSATGPLDAAMQASCIYPSVPKFSVSSEPHAGPVIQWLEDPERQEVCA